MCVCVFLLDSACDVAQTLHEQPIDSEAKRPIVAQSTSISSIKKVESPVQRDQQYTGRVIDGAETIETKSRRMHLTNLVERKHESCRQQCPSHSLP